MAIKYSETTAEPDDAEGRVLEALADGQAYVFVVATIDGSDIDLRLASQHGVGIIRAILAKTLASLPQEE